MPTSESMPTATHLESMSIRGFRGLEHLELEDLGQINLIVGQNDVGKTSVLEAAMLLSGPPMPQVLVAIQNLRRHAVVDPTDISLLLHRLNPDQRVEMSASTPRDERRLTVEMSKNALTIDTESQLQNESGHSADGRADMVSNSSALQSAVFHYNAEIRPHGAGASRTFGCRISVADAQIRMTPTTGAGDPEEGVLSARLLVPGPGHEAEPISDVLIAKRQDELLECLRTIHPSIAGIATKNDMAYVDIGLDSMIPLNMCGSGFVRAAMIFAVCLAGDVQILLIDELGSGLHHAAVRPLIKALLTVSEQQGVQVFATTHNLEVLRSLEETLGDDSFIRFRDKTVAYALAKRLDGCVKGYRYDYEQFAHAVSRGIEIR